MPAKRPKIETGPFGGRFYRKGNKKIYITKNPKSGPCKGVQTEVGKRGGVYCMKNGKRVYYNASKVQKTKSQRTTTRQRRQRAAPKPRQPKTARQPRVNKHLKWLVDHEQVLLPIQEKDGAKAFITSVQAKTRKSPAVHAKYWRAQYGDAPLDGLDGRMYVVKGNRWVLFKGSQQQPPQEEENDEFEEYNPYENLFGKKTEKEKQFDRWFNKHEAVINAMQRQEPDQYVIIARDYLTYRKAPPVHAKFWKKYHGDASLDGLDGRMYVVKGNRWVLARASAPPPPPPRQERPQQPQRGRFWRQPGCKKNANILFQYFPPDVLTQDNVFRQYKDLMLTNHPDRFRYNHPDASPEELEMVRNRWEETLDAKRYLMNPKWECLD